MSDYPILVERWDAKHPADMAVCERCGYERTWNGEDGDPYDLCIKHEAALPNGCHGQIVMKYDVGERCAGCGTLDYSMSRALNGCCSRRCMLQVEYAASLKTEEARA